MLDVVVGAVLTVLSYSSLAIVLLIATLATSALIPVTVALGLVLGANIGSGVLAMLATAQRLAAGAPAAARQPDLQGRRRRCCSCSSCRRCTCCCSSWCRPVHQQVVLFHLVFNVVLAILFIGFTGLVGRTVDRWLRRAVDRRRARAGRATSTRWR